MIVRNGMVALPGHDDFVRADLRIEGGRFSEIAQRMEQAAGEEVLDAAGLLVFPGAIDPHVHFDEPGFTHREDFLHGTSEAARGGVTTVVDMPCTSLPPVTTAEAFDNKLGIVGKSAIVDYAFFGGVSGHTVEASLGPGGAPGEMAALAERGVVGFKCYFISGMDTFTRVTHDDFARIVREAERVGRPVLLHAEDLDYVTAATARIKAARGNGAPGWMDYALSRDEAAETVAVASALALASGHEASLHIVHVGTAAAARLVAATDATCETCAHYLAFSREDFDGGAGRPARGASLKTMPVVKARGEAEALWQLLAMGDIDFVTSDHAPAQTAEKETGNPWTAYGGIPGTGTMFPYLLSEGYFAGRLTLSRLLEASSGAAARRYGLSARKGSIEVGKDADLVLVDPSATTILKGEELFSKGRITPFEGMVFKGRIAATWLRGHPVYDARSRDAAGQPTGGRIVAAPGTGKFLRWGYR
jgi:allantoinase